jgi:probable HAF family extracellular repeat protein
MKTTISRLQFLNRWGGDGMKIQVKKALLSAAAAACLLSAAGGAQAAAYRITEITDATFSRAFDINNQGQVVGYSRTSGTATANDRAFLWDSVNGMQSLSGLPNYASHAYAINDAGQIAGDYRAGSAAESARAFRWTDGSVQNLGNLSGEPGHTSTGRGINESGQVAGYGNTADGARGALWGSGAVQQLPVLPGKSTSHAYDMNDNGLVVGQSGNRAFIYDGTTMTSLGTLPGGFFGASSIAYAVNDNGWVVGRSEGSDTFGQAFLWNGTTMEGLGDLPNGYFLSSAYDVNNRGQVVGVGSITASAATASRAFIWDADNGLVDLNMLIDRNDPMFGTGFRLTEARGINDLGQIVGFGVFNGAEHAFLLTPVPEPHQYGMMLAGLGLVGWIVRRRRDGSFSAIAA